MSDVNALIEKAKEKGTFSVLDAAKGRGYPKDEKKVYTDTAPAYAIKVIERQIADLGTEDSDKINALDAEIEELRKTLESSALTFRMRGISRGVIDSIIAQGKEKGFESTDYGDGARWCNKYYLAEHIVEVVDAEGNVDDSHWDVDKVTELQAFLPDESFEALTLLVHELTFASAYFDASVTPDFSLRS